MKTVCSFLIVTFYIVICLRLRTDPRNYFQLNARYFCADKGIFSKINIDNLIPAKWKLKQGRLVDDFQATRFPIFVKPEWGQNSVGITRADDADQLQEISLRLNGSATRYIAQEGAPEKREFELYFVFADAAREKAKMITVTEVINQTHEYPINGIFNEDTYYHDITDQFSAQELQALVQHNLEIGRFGHSRLSVRANSMRELIKGHFHVIELNLYIPMPINVLDRNYSWWRRLGFIGKVSYALAEATREIKHNGRVQPIFTRMVMYGRSQKANNARVTQAVYEKA